MSESRDQLMDVAQTFSEVARALSDKGDVPETLGRIVNLAVATLDSCEFAGISFVEGRKITSPASSDEVPRIVDKIQSEVDEGPCLDAIREHEVFQTGDLAAEDRWPQFARRAHEETGIQSILAVRLFVEEDTLGALNLYATAKDAFDDTDVALASVFAAHAAVAVSAATREQNLERKAATRDLIGRAKGMLMAREHVTDDQAFDMLRRASQRLNVKLTAVAQQVTSGEQPSEPGGGLGPDGSAVAADPA
jgi:GAF domain-containing protein